MTETETLWHEYDATKQCFNEADARLKQAFETLESLCERGGGATDLEIINQKAYINYFSEQANAFALELTALEAKLEVRGEAVWKYKHLGK